MELMSIWGGKRFQEIGSYGMKIEVRTSLPPSGKLRAGMLASHGGRQGDEALVGSASLSIQSQSVSYEHHRQDGEQLEGTALKY